MDNLGKWLVLAGLGLVLIGGLVWGLSRLGLPVGNLPGDIRIQRDGFSCFIPIATSILLSLILTLVLNVVIRFLKR